MKQRAVIKADIINVASKTEIINLFRDGLRRVDKKRADSIQYFHLDYLNSPKLHRVTNEENNADNFVTARLIVAFQLVRFRAAHRGFFESRKTEKK